jgi:hypothetical protein
MKAIALSIVVLVLMAVTADSADVRGDRKEPDPIAWGKAVGGLKAGIGFRPGEQHACRVGETATFAIYLHNAGAKSVSLSHIEPLFDEFLPKVADGTGKEFRVVPGPMNLGEVAIVNRTLEPGQTIRLGYAWFHIRPLGWKGPVLAQTLAAESGKYWVYHSGFPIRRKGDDADKYSGSTGRVELEIKDAPEAKR